MIPTYIVRCTIIFTIHFFLKLWLKVANRKTTEITKSCSDIILAKHIFDIFQSIQFQLDKSKNVIQNTKIVIKFTKRFINSVLFMTEFGKFMTNFGKVSMKFLMFFCGFY